MWHLIHFIGYTVGKIQLTKAETTRVDSKSGRSAALH